MKTALLYLSFPVLLVLGCTGWEAQRLQSQGKFPQEVLQDSKAPEPLKLGAQKLLAYGTYLEKQGYPQGLKTLKISQEPQDAPLYLGFSTAGLPGKNPEKTLFAPPKDPTAAPGIWVPRHHLRPHFEEPSPFLTAYLAWPEDLQALWYFREAAGLLLSPKGTPAQTQGARDFLAVQLTSGYLIQAHPGNQIVTEFFGRRVADRRIFSGLIQGLQESLQRIYSLGEDQKIRLEKTTYQKDAWLQEFRGLFSQRFQTNEYQEFGQKGLTDAQVFTQELWQFTPFEIKFRQLPGGLGQFIQSWNALENSAAAVEAWLSSR